GYNEGVFTGNLLSLLQSGAEFIGGGLWLLGGTSGSLALAPATGGSSVSAIPAISGSTLAIWTHAAAIGGMSIQNIMSGNGYHLPNAKIGANGTQVSSKTTWKNGKTERVDVENPAPGIRDGDIHYHDSNNTKWRYDIKNNEFINPKTGELAPQKIQKLLKNKDILKGIQKALEVLGK
ncbi:hypothetical protein ACWOFR_12960, partial [Carnobacterium gallinarum]